MSAQGETVAAECSGSVKIGEFMGSNYILLKMWKSCKIKVLQDIGTWILRFIPVADTSRCINVHLYRKGKYMVKEVSRKNKQTMFIKMFSGDNIHFKDCPDGDKVARLIEDIKHKALTTSAARKSVTPSPVCSTPRNDGSPPPKRLSPGTQAKRELSSSPLFTHVKEKQQAHSEQCPSDIQFVDENIESFQNRSFPSLEKKTPTSRFLQRATEKSKSVENLGSGKFYGSDSSGRSYSSFGIKSGSAHKTYSARKPGMLNYYPEREKLSMSNVKNNLNYSWPKTSPLVSKELQSSLRGFSNLGNTCYMNAILQALFGLWTFGEDLIHLSCQARKYMMDNYRNSLYFALAHLYRASKMKESTDKQKQLLTSVKNAISTSAKRFSGYEQHDAHEFLSQVIDQVKEDVLKENKKVLKSQQVDETIEKNEKEDDHIHHDIASDKYINPSLLNFEFQVIHTITCLKCEEEVKKIEQFNDLSIDMPKRMNVNEKSTIQDALDQFFKKEEIEYTCEACQHKQVEVTHKFFRAPRIIILHLKRYHFNSITTVNRKVGRNMKIPLYLTLWGHAGEDTYPPYYSQIRESYPGRSVLTTDENFNNRDGAEDSDILMLTKKPKKYDGFTFKQVRSPVVTVPDEDSENDFQTIKSPNYRTAMKEKPKNEYGELEKALEESKIESERKKKEEASFIEFSNGMTEEEQMKVAMEQSLLETTETSQNFDANQSLRGTDVENTPKRAELDSRMDCEFSSENNVKGSQSTKKSWPFIAASELKDINESGYQSNNVSLIDDEPTFNSSGTNPAITTGYQSPECDMETSGDDVVMDNVNDSITSEPCSKKVKSTSHQDLISILDKHEPKLTPEKPTLKVYATPKRLDALFSKVSESKSSFSKLAASEAGHSSDIQSKCEGNITSTMSDKVERPKKRPPADIEFGEISSDSESDNKDSKNSRRTSQEEKRIKVDSDTGEIVSEDRGNLGFNLLGDTKTDAPTSNSEDPVWIGRKRKEQEDNELQRAIEMSLNDQAPDQVVDSVDDDLTKAIELSLKDFTESQGLPWQADEESFLSDVPASEMSEEDMKRRQDNLENGEMPFSYRLVSIVSHLGTSSAGHYISDVYNLEKKCWYSYNDSEVSRMSEECVRQSREKTGYIFFYMNKDLLEELDSERKDTSKENQENVLNTPYSKEKKSVINNKTPLKSLNSSHLNVTAIR